MPGPLSPCKWKRAYDPVDDDDDDEGENKCRFPKKRVCQSDRTIIPRTKRIVMPAVGRVEERNAKIIFVSAHESHHLHPPLIRVVFFSGPSFD